MLACLLRLPLTPAGRRLVPLDSAGSRWDNSEFPNLEGLDAQEKLSACTLIVTSPRLLAGAMSLCCRQWGQLVIDSCSTANRGRVGCEA